MTEQEYRGAARDLLYLADCAVNRKIPEAGRIDSMDIERVLELAKEHMIGAMAAMALESAGYRTKDTRTLIAVAQRRTAVFDHALAEVEAALDAAGIWYLPLKGALLQSCYPQYGMREMADRDVLFDAARADELRTIMEGLGFATLEFGTGNHDTYHKSKFVSFEMHRSLFRASRGDALYNYYSDIENRLVKGEGYRRSLTDEDFYIYMTAHEYKHYAAGGTGLRSLIDAYAFLKAHSPDMDYVARELDKMGIADFERANRELAMHMFGGELTDEQRDMLDYIISSGTYGTTEHRRENIKRSHGWNGLQYAISRLIVPISKNDSRYAAYAADYHWFYEKKYRIPLLPFCRAGRAVKRALRKMAGK